MYKHSILEVEPIVKIVDGVEHSLTANERRSLYTVGTSLLIPERSRPHTYELYMNINIHK